MQTVNMLWLEDYVKTLYKIDELEIGNLYKVSNIKIETPDGFKNTVGFIKKSGKKAVVEFESGIVHECLHNHMFIPETGSRLYTYDISAGDRILTKDGSCDVVKSVVLTDEDMVAYDLSVDSPDSIYVTADGIQHHNTGKTQTVERVLKSLGKHDGDGYFKNTGTASAAGIFVLLYHNRKNLVVFDDSDGALGDQDARNLIKAATDTKKKRKMVWNKKSSFIYDPDSPNADEYEDDVNMAPKYYDFEGKIIFISNLPLNKLDPDGALRTRAFIISIDPTDAELFDFMEKILFDIELADEDATLSESDRRKVLAIVKASKRKNDISLRKLVRGLNLAASRAPGWEKLIDLYA